MHGDQTACIMFRDHILTVEGHVTVPGSLEESDCVFIHTYTVSPRKPHSSTGCLFSVQRSYRFGVPWLCQDPRSSTEWACLHPRACHSECPHLYLHSLLVMTGSHSEWLDKVHGRPLRSLRPAQSSSRDGWLRREAWPLATLCPCRD